ncbi:MAG: XdhC family protein, partial [bacterium]
KDFIIIMTHCHDEDYKVLIRVIHKPWFYLGVIGSRKKAVEIREKLENDGISPELISRISCPIGLSIPTHTPWEIAIAIAGQLIEKLKAFVSHQPQNQQVIYREDAIA